MAQVAVPPALGLPSTRGTQFQRSATSTWLSCHHGAARATSSLDTRHGAAPALSQTVRRAHAFACAGSCGVGALIASSSRRRRRHCVGPPRETVATPRQVACRATRGARRVIGERTRDLDDRPREQERRPSNFKEYLLFTEAEQPIWYRLSDIYLTFLGAFLFYLSVCEPRVSLKYGLDQVEDVVNVNFFVRFVLLFWANDFKLSWLWTGKALLDLLSCLPILAIPARFLGGAPLEKSIDIFEIARFLRLLRLSLPSTTDEGVLRSRWDPLQLSTVLIALGGTIALSATLLFLYENPQQLVASGAPVRTFEDTILYMVNIFTNKETVFAAQTRGGKQVTVAATLVGTIFLPFLISGGFQFVMGSGSFLLEQGAAMASSAPVPGRVPAGSRASPASPAEWAAVLKRLDCLEEAGLLRPAEARELRRRCRAEEGWALALDACYGQAYSEAPDGQAGKVYASRLREWLEEGTVG